MSICRLLSCLVVFCLCPFASATDVYVAPDGNDADPGTQAAPVKTLERAKTLVRDLKNDTPGESITVRFAQGTYPFTQAVQFTKEDSGTNGAGVLYSAASPDAEVRFTGGIEVKNLQPVADPAILARLPEEARGKVQVADLTAQGITDLGKLSVGGFAKPSAPAEAELFYDDEPMTLSRWPNEGFMKLAGKDDLEHLITDTDRVARWTEETDPWVFGYWHHDWAEMREPIVAIDAEKKMIVRSKDVKPQYGVSPERSRWYAFNLLSEIDQPGEYYIDREHGKLYFWPPHDGGTCVVSVADSLVQMDGVENVVFDGITFENCRATAIKMANCTDCRVVRSIIRNTGHRAIASTNGLRVVVDGCDVYQNGEGGISLAGGDRIKLLRANNWAKNNHVHHYSRRARTYKPGIAVSGVGNNIANNLVHHGPHMALSAGGNNHIVGFNEIHNVVYESGDAGAYYVGRDWTQRGNKIIGNYWHDIVGGTGYGGMTIYLDDQHSGHTIKHNIFERCSQAIFIGGGDDNIVENNVFIDCWRAAHIDNRGMGWQKAATDDPNWTLRTRFRDMPVDSEIWKQSYPHLANTLEDEPNIPKRNVFRRNISAGGVWNHIHEGTRQYQTIEDNLVFDDDPDWVRLEKDEHGRPIKLIFKAPEAVEAIGFEPISVDGIGLFKEGGRATWPVEHEVRRAKLPHHQD